MSITVSDVFYGEKVYINWTDDSQMNWLYYPSYGLTISYPGHSVSRSIPIQTSDKNNYSYGMVIPLDDLKMQRK